MPRSLTSLVLAVLLLVPALAPADSNEAPASEPAPAQPRKKTVAGGRDISTLRDTKLIWTEMLEVLYKIYEVADDRDMRALVLSPQEQALFIAFTKRLYDLGKELIAVTEALDPEGKRAPVPLRRNMRDFYRDLGELRAVSGGQIHRDIPRELNDVARVMKSIWKSYPDAENRLGPEGLPSYEEIKPTPRY